MKMLKKSCRDGELERLRLRYAGRGKEGKTRLLDEFCEHYSYERKHAIKLLGDGLPKATNRRVSTTKSRGFGHRVGARPAKGWLLHVTRHAAVGAGFGVERKSERLVSIVPGREATQAMMRNQERSGPAN